MTYQPDHHKPVRLQPRMLSCGHPAAPDQNDEHDECPACYVKRRVNELETFERTHSIDVKIKGTPAQVQYARGIRHRVLQALYERIAQEPTKKFLFAYVDEYRKHENAQWFIARRFTSVAKLKFAPREKSTAGSQIKEHYRAAFEAAAKENS